MTGTPDTEKPNTLSKIPDTEKLESEVMPVIASFKVYRIFYDTKHIISRDCSYISFDFFFLGAVAIQNTVGLP